MRNNGKHAPHANGNGRSETAGKHSPHGNGRVIRLGNDRYTLITGGAGFIGSNVANRLMRYGRRVMVLDNLSRRGVEQNLKWLQETHGDRLKVRIGDIRNTRVVREAV